MNVLSLWNIGKFIRDNYYSCMNVHISCSKYLSYYYGNSYFYSLFYIRMMEKLYLYFPIYLDQMSLIKWDSYLELLKLNRKECYFYYHILLFCGDDLNELKKMIYSNLYLRI